MRKAYFRKASFKWHRKLTWIGLFAVLMFAVSALTHPLLSWTGPQAANFRPPNTVINAQQVRSIATVLKRHNIQQALVVKLVPSARGVVLQVTDSATAPRRYFDLASGTELPNYDQQHAAWLAQYYVAGDSPLAIKSIRFQTEFDSAYPWVNRLLPVYKVEFSDAANSSAYIYTEINALAGMGNDYKTQLQAVFRNLHTWAWLDHVDGARIIVMALLLLSIFALSAAGVGLLLMLRARKNMPRKTKLHRFTGYVVALPLLAFCVSGFWHLLHYGFNETNRGLKLGEPMLLASLNENVSLADLPDVPLNQVSVVSYNDQLYYRLGFPAMARANVKPASVSSGGEHAHHDMSSDVASRTARFKGQPTEHAGLYFAAKTGQQSDLNDEQLAQALASQYLQLDNSQITSSTLITRFGLHYDFRNKRLPVWQIDVDSDVGDKVFIDPTTGMLVDRLVNKDRYEAYSFGFLHKWNFLTPLMGRFWRDMLVVVILSLIILLSLLGVAMRLKR
ncbi:PepSY-associated TM helix domain-containing protein [Arenicella xantha]|uniref:PepSY-associated transmembrane protein n=1 Tax=Arenicella xantha TaxID=644221 RepID=A0A395JK02_9GAMM|nr:PepSY-associated TM helix domain-containing protein [Arenicella xantha]RBP51106.1 PepSY-associated transmembrane protein [Arenicella xantha]